MAAIRSIFAALLILLVAIPARGMTIVECVSLPVPEHRACCARAEQGQRPAKCCVLTQLPAEPRQASPAIPPVPDLALMVGVTVVPEPAVPAVDVRPVPADERPRDGPDAHECHSPRGPPISG